MQKLVYLLLAVMLILTTTITCAPAKPVTPSEEAAEPLLLLPDKVILEFQTDPEAARAKYENHLVKVQGRVFGKKTWFGEHGVVIFSFEFGERTPFCDIVCWFKNPQEADALNVDDEVTIVGVFGECSSGPASIWMEDCHVTERE